MNRLATLALASTVAAGCSIGAPPGFSGGDSWTFPLVGPLEDGLLITPVWIDDKGPYLMGIDPDSPVSQIDEAIVSELGLHNGIGPKMLDEDDTNRPSRMAEVLRIRLGTLTVRNRTVAVMKVGSLGAAGRQLRGILGRDVIADSLAFGFDRELGVGFLATQQGFTAPTNATVVSYGVITNRLSVEFQPSPRRVAKIEIDGKSFHMHLDLGGVTSQLRKSLWGKAGLSPVPVASDLRDEVGTVRHTTEAAVANSVVAGALSASGILFAPYGDKRWEEEDVDGTLGLNYFRTVNVTANWDQARFYLIPRGDVIASARMRVNRWGSTAVSGCEHLGCVAIEMIDPAGSTEPTPADAPQTAPATPGTPVGASAAPGANGPPGSSAPAIMPEPPRPVVVLHRDASARGLDLELMLVAVGADGQPTDLPRLIVNLPGSVDDLSNQLDPSYTGANIVVVDLSPYPRSCARGAGCLQSLAATH